MTNPTSNFGWQMPTSTDLVTDLPADFEVFGQAVDTSLADLKGGTTGQILSKATSTDMDFTWITNDVGDITAVTAGTGISGGGTSGAVTITNDMATTITASGDIVVGTGSGTYDNLPIGTTGQILTADTTVSPYKVKWATPVTTPTFVGVAAYINATASSFTQNVQATLSFPAEEYDSNSFHDNSTNNSRLTIPTGYGGKYLVTSVILTPDDWNGYGYAYLYKNGAAMNNPSGLYNDGRFGSLNLTPGVSQLVGSSTFSLAQGDYIEMRIQSAWTTGSHAIYARFTATWLGA